MAAGFVIVPTSSAFATLPQPVTKIQHIIVIMQENHSFDNFFGTFPGLDPKYALNDTKCQLTDIHNPNSNCVHPFNGDSINAQIQSMDLLHDWSSAQLAHDNGLMDAFVYAQTQKSRIDFPTYAMSYFTSKSLPNYWDYATYYSLDANFFSSSFGPSYPNHLYMVAAQDYGIISNDPHDNLQFQTIINEFKKTNIDWKFYAADWKDSLRCVSNPFKSNSKALWNILPSFPLIQTSRSTCMRIVNTSDFARDVQNGHLPQVAWITPAWLTSDHPGEGDLNSSQIYVAKIINDIESKPALWNNTAIFLTWDDYGGYYDHMVPNQVDSEGYSFRVPLIVISPYAKTGTISYGAGQQHDFTSILSTIESNWNLKSLTSRDANSQPLWYLFNFSQPILQPLSLPTNNLAIYPPTTCISQNICHVGVYGNPVIIPFVQTNKTMTMKTEGDPDD